MKRLIFAFFFCISAHTNAQFVSGQVLTASGLNAALSQKIQASDLSNSSDPTKGAALIGYGSGTVASALNANALQFVTAAGAANIKPNTAYSYILPTASAATITGGGDGTNMQLVGYTHNRQEFAGPGSSFTYNYPPSNSDPSTLRLFKAGTDGAGTLTTLVWTTSGSPTGTQWNGTIGGGTVSITTGTALLTGETLIVEDPNAVTATTGQAPSYSSIHGAYDGSIQSGLMQHIIASAHSRIYDRDGVGGHNGIILGSFHRITGPGAYNGILFGTGSEVSGSATNGSMVLGGIYSKNTGTTSVALACERCKVSSTYAIAQGQSQNVSGTASGALGRGNTVSAANALATGQNGLISGDNSTGHGNSYSLTHSYTFNAAGYKTRSIAAGDVILWGYRDTSAGYAGGSAGLNPVIQDHRLYWNGYWTDTSSHLITNAIDETTTDIPITAGAVTLYRIRVTARGGSLRGGAWIMTCAVQAPSSLSSGTPATLIGGACTSDFSQVDSGLGTSSNAAGVSVAINSSTGAGLQVTAKQRADTAVATKWAAVIEVLEVN
ncbi:hypothetical protein KMC43_gp48 [Ralstonia phage Raharianne]|uniref:Uncharacterized protein n=2 Tax=Rahariannevirus raharianne TaxID=2846050 RepID=A0A7G5BBE4_9CAUD|nr:hypothetical protein KMC43_gp48 [Ralstonia phage Raharianne]QMV32423.1 hypothetical protein U2_00048 [Ralstonia phage Albius]QMV33617.1 hypothetical protein Y2_00048 [Ralstonia phage Raharianne]